VPSNITLEVLPPHSPELNPVEQIWDDVRYNYTRNQTFTEADNLWNTLAGAMRAYSVDPDKVKSITNQEWLYQKEQD
jgi:transposase